LLTAVVGCATFQPLSLPPRPDLKTQLAELDTAVPAAGTAAAGRQIAIERPLSIDDIGLLAILNDPDLRSERGELGAAEAGLVQAKLLPNPAASFNYGALINGPGTSAAVGGALAEDIAAIVTRGTRIAAARTHLHAVGADLLWGEWQVAQKARQLALDIYSGERMIGLTRDQLRLLGRELAQVKTAIAAGNLSLGAAAPLLAAAAASEQSLTALRLERLKNWQTLDGLLGLVPSVRFAIARPVFGPPPPDLAALVASLPERRPDLVALRLGYRSAEADLRAAILGQFPAFSLGPTYGSDTTGVVSAGPSLTLSLPVFDRNQGRIAAAKATRLLLHEQYEARLDTAVAEVHGLLAQLASLSAALDRARQAAAAASAIARTARQAYAQGNLDERSLTDFETTALERELEVAALEHQQGDDRIFVAVELGLGLPATQIALGPMKS
jgi:outer membrane protein TolC